MSEFLTWKRHLLYGGTFLNNEIITLWERNHFKKCDVHFIITFCFILGICQPLLGEGDDFTSKIITLQFSDVFFKHNVMRENTTLAHIAIQLVHIDPPIRKLDACLCRL
jgi:hypothetical protein